jgi:D-alanine-D-alanine ligase
VPDNKTVAILHGEVPADAPADEQDVLDEVQAVSTALTSLGYRPQPLVFSFNLADTIARLRQLKPAVVFNLVESVNGHNRLMHLAGSILETLRMPYTGTNECAQFVTTNKVLAKQFMHGAGIATPAWQSAEEIGVTGLKFPPPLILKPLGEDASQGIDDSSVCRDQEACHSQIRLMDKAERHYWFAEAFVEGREFNVSLLAKPYGVEVLPPAEMLFRDFPPEKPAIVNYRAKWDKSSFEYHNTVRSFTFQAHDQGLLAEIHAIAAKCWKTFGLCGYARVDLRVDSDGVPWVIEINCNPCISPDAGFVAACAEAGLSYEQTIQRIVEDALLRASRSQQGAR